MESTESGDFSVGSIVWVRRRNGSWWPGKIVGPEELSTSHLTSPRSGTPVKLLGREDASVYVSNCSLPFLHDSKFLQFLLLELYLCLLLFEFWVMIGYLSTNENSNEL